MPSRGILPRRMKLTKVIQRFDPTAISDAASAVRKELEKLGPLIKPGSSIALAIGSRGICGIDTMARAAAQWLLQAGCRPFIVPAMGSHGGATAEGQSGILASYGIDERRTGAPVRSSMETVELDSRGLPLKLFMDAQAWSSDGVILINRVKPHTDFHGRYESGLAKMCVLGLGKHAQALEIHRFGVRGLKELMPECARRILKTGKVIGGIAIVENAFDSPAVITALPAGRIMDAEPGLLDTARLLMPSLPVDEADILIVDFIGKDVSGTGMDPNVIGRLAIRGEPEPERPRIGAIMARDLTPGSHGNALGVGFAEVTTRRLFSKIDYHPMYENVYTSTFLERAKVPVVAEDDGRALEFCMRACGPREEGEERIIRIRDTLHIGELYVSEAIKRELSGCKRIEMTEKEIPLVGEDGWCPDSGVWG
jgi:hypothetical protein